MLLLAFLSIHPRPEGSFRRVCTTCRHGHHLRNAPAVVMSRQSRRSSPRHEVGNGSRCAKDKKVPPPRPAAVDPPLGDLVVGKQHLAKMALHNTSCAGCVASVRALLTRPLSELRMLKGVVDDAGPSHYRLKEAYGHNPKRTEQLLDTFPMASVLKKVQPVGSAQRCQLHRRLYSLAGLNSSVGGGFRGGEGGSGGTGSNGGGRGGGAGGGGVSTAEPWDWEDAWERMPPNLKYEVATVKASALEAAMHQATDANRFCSDCKHNVVQAHDILMGKIDLEGSENEEEFDEEIFLPFEDRVFDGHSGSLEDKLLICDVMDVEDLIYFYEDFSSQDFDSSCTGQQRHAATLEHGQREVRSILGALVLNQLRSIWHAQMAQLQGEQYLFCLTVDAIRTLLASHGAAPDGADDLVAIDAEERCAAEERRQKRRQKRKDKKKAGRVQPSVSTAAPGASSASPTNDRGGNDSVSRGGRRSSNAAEAGGNRGSGGKKKPTVTIGTAKRSRDKGPVRQGRRAVSSDGSSSPCTVSSASSASGTEFSMSPLHDGSLQHNLSTEPGAECAGSGSSEPGIGHSGGIGVVSDGDDEDARREGEIVVEEGMEDQTRSEAARAQVRAGMNSRIMMKAAASHGGFGAGGLAFQLECDEDDDIDGDNSVDHDLISEMEQLKASIRSRSDIDFLRKTLRQNYDRFISQGAGRVR